MDGGKDKLCPICGRLIGRNKICCSQKCYSEYRQHYRKCAVCGKMFRAHPSDGVVCCSPKCSHIWRSWQHKAGIYNKSVEHMVESRKHCPKLMRCPGHCNAKIWTIQAPDGKIYECRNLLNFFREHADIIDGAPKQAWDGISKIKYGMQGKRKRPTHQWKGWKLINWED